MISKSVLLGATGFLIGALVLAGGPGAQGKVPFSTTTVVLVNATSGWLQLYIDDARSCSAPGGDTCSDQVEIGRHCLRAESTDGRSTKNNCGYIGEDGKRFTVTDE